jgi:hypothetical protein
MGAIFRLAISAQCLRIIIVSGVSRTYLLELKSAETLDLQGRHAAMAPFTGGFVSGARFTHHIATT